MTAVVDKAQERREHLALANRNRIDRARLLEQLRGRQVEPADVINDPPACIAGMLVYAFLLEVPGFGNFKLRQLNAKAVRQHVNLAAPLGELPPLQRQWLVRELGARWSVLASRPQG